MRVVKVRSILAPQWWRHPLRWWRLRRLRADGKRIQAQVNELVHERIAEQLERTFLLGPVGDPLEEIKRCMRTVAEQDAQPVYVIVANHQVPAGRVLRYYDTHGRLWAYVNRADLEMLPRREVDDQPHPLTMARPLLWGIPVVVE